MSSMYLFGAIYGPRAIYSSNGLVHFLKMDNTICYSSMFRVDVHLIEVMKKSPYDARSSMIGWFPQSLMWTGSQNPMILFRWIIFFGSIWWMKWTLVTYKDFNRQYRGCHKRHRFIFIVKTQNFCLQTISYQQNPIGHMNAIVCRLFGIYRIS